MATSRDHDATASEPASADGANRRTDPSGKGESGPPWRVEGTQQRSQAPRRKLPGGGWFWLFVAGMLAINLAIATRVPSGLRGLRERFG